MDRRSTTQRTIAMYWRALLRYKGWFVFHAGTVAIAVVLQNILLPFALARGINALPGFVNHPTDFGAVFGPIIALYIVAQVGQFVCWRLSGMGIVILENRVIRDLDRRIFAHLTTLSYRFFNNSFGGALVAQANRFVGAFERLYDTFTFDIMSLVLRFGFSFVIIFTFAPTVALGLAVFCTVFTGSALFLANRKMPHSKRAAAAQTNLTARLADNIANMAAIKYFARETSEIRAFNTISQRKFDLSARDWAIQEVIYGWQALLMIVFETIVFIVTLTLVSHGAISIGQLFLIQAYVWNIFMSLWGVSRIARNIERSLSDAAEMTEILSTEPEVKDHPNATRVIITKGLVECRDLTFAYSDARPGELLFDRLNLTVAPGERIGLVGPSGGGKTTITKLLLRLMDITGGAILLDGHNIATMRQTDVRSAMSYVPQEPLLFHRSLLDNIRYGRPEATIGQVKEAARKAHAAEFIEKLPQGYDTLVGERGVKLSGGQRQRVAIARAMLKDAPILVLDEATSALDSESERLIQDALGTLMKGRTTVVIAHRLSTIQKMDRIVVLEDGAITEQGSHQDLLAQKGHYAKLWAHQSGGFLED